MKFNNRNVFISPNAKIGSNVRIGDNSVIYDNVEIGDNSIIANDCILGEPLYNYYANQDSYVNPVLSIGAGAFIRSHTIIYCGCKIGDNFSTGHRVTIREYTELGNGCRIGTLSDIQGYSKFGDHCWLHSNVHIGQQSIIGDFVFIYPYVVLTNDPHPPSNICIGAEIGDYTQIAVHSVLLPGVKVGKHVLIGASTLVNKNVPDYQLVVGNPGKPVGDIRTIISKETGKSHYPWPYNFSRGMPWEHIGYDNWLNLNKKNDE